MDENIISKPQDISNTKETEGDTDVDSVRERVFDITPDLNINPVTDVSDSDVTPTPQDLAKATELASSLGKSIGAASFVVPNIPIQGSGTSPVPQNAPIVTPSNQSARDTTIAPKENITHPIPLQDLSQTLNKIRTAPANPPAKTLNNFVPHVERPSVYSAINTGNVNRSQNDTSSPLSGNTAVPHAAQNFSKLKAMRTFEGDIAEVMAHRRTSTASIAIAQSKKIEGVSKIANNSPSPSHSTKNFFFFIASLILIAGGLMAAYYLYSKSPIAPAPKPPVVASLIPGTSLFKPDSQTTISLDGQNQQAILSSITKELSKSQSQGTINEIIPITTKNAIKSRITAAEMVNLIDVAAPDMVKRSLDDPWMLGTYVSPTGEKGTFIIATNTFFQNAFAGMLAWEGLMSDDLKKFLYLNNSSKNFTVRGQFKDRIIANRDVREFVTSEGKILFLYSFIDSEKLVVSGNESALQEILNRLEKQAFIR